MSKHDQIISALSRLPIFTGLDQQKILKMLKACQKESFKTGKVLFYQGEESDKMYWLTRSQ